MNNFLVANPMRCIGCRTCELACVLAHCADGAISRGDLGSFNPRLRVIKTATLSAPVQCRHCEDAPCANVCPTGAIVNEDDTIQVLPEKCIGCKNCLMACPFGAIEIAPRMVAGKQLSQPRLKLLDALGIRSKDAMVALKCDLCVNRPEGPACAGVCPTNAFTPVLGKTMQASLAQRRKSSAEKLADFTTPQPGGGFEGEYHA